MLTPLLALPAVRFHDANLVMQSQFGVFTVHDEPRLWDEHSQVAVPVTVWVLGPEPDTHAVMPLFG